MFEFLKKIMSGSRPSMQQQIADLLQAGHTLTVRWDCGGDERFVYTAVDGQEDDDPDPDSLPELLDEYLTELLNLPDAGEFNMEGTGRIVQQGREVVIEYESRATTYWDDDSSWQNEFTDEQLLEMSIERATPPASADAAPAAAATGEAADDAPETGGTYDPDMSAEYSGRRVLFTWP